MLSRLFLLSFFVLIYSRPIDAQACNGGSFYTQSQVDEFLVNNPTCTTINGALFILSATSDPITNLNGFANITQITGGFTLRHTQITTLGSLQNANILGQIDIAFNLNLSSLNLTGNNNVNAISIQMKANSSFQMNGNSFVVNGIYISCPSGTITANSNFSFGTATLIARKISGFNGINTNNSGLDITADTILGFNNVVNLSALSLSGLLDQVIGFNAIVNTNQTNISTHRLTPPSLPLSIVNQHLKIHNCINIQNLSGFGLTSQVKSLILSNNPKLMNLLGAENITFLSKLEVENNDSLSTLAGLDQLKLIDNNLIISNNNILIDISAINTLRFIANSVTFINNPLLNHCCILAILQNRNRIGDITLSNNGANCSLLYTVLELSCLDSDLDGIFDSSDNCDFVSNPNQLDNDGDGVGNLCDNCPNVSNPNQEDSDGNNIGNACQTSPIDTVSIENGDLYIKDPQLGLIIKSIDGLCYRIKVDGSGQVIASLITCPN